MTGSRTGSVDPPGTVPAGGVANGVACGVASRPGTAVGLVCCVPGAAVGGFCAGFGCPGMIGTPGGAVGSPGAGVGRGVDRGTCASAAFSPPNKINARTAGVTKLRDTNL